MQKKSYFVLASLALALAAGCKRPVNDGLSIIGSTTVTPLMEVLVDRYTEETQQRLTIQSTGSSSGIQAVSEGVSDLGMSSRSLTSDELAQVEAYPFAIDALIVIVHPKNPITNLSSEQVFNIFSGKITNWQEVGGDNMPVIVVSREAGSGARSSFEDFFGLVQDKRSLVDQARPLISSGTGAIKATVANNEQAISYVTISVADNAVKTLSLDGVSPMDKANLVDGSYALVHPFYLVMGDHSSQLAREFTSFVLSEQGQQIVEEFGLVRIQ